VAAAPDAIGRGASAIAAECSTCHRNHVDFERVNGGRGNCKCYSTLRSKGNVFALSKNLLIHSSMALEPFDGPWPLLQFRNLF
jgi:hypothetical protein